MDEEKLELYLEQYRRCYTTWLHLISLSWQIATTTILSATTISTISFQLLSDPLARASAFLLAGFFSFLMMITLAAIRRSLDAVSIYMKYLEKEIFQIKILPVETNETLEFIESYGGWVVEDKLYRHFLIKQRSYFWLQYALLSLCFILWSLAIYSIVTTIF